MKTILVFSFLLIAAVTNLYAQGNLQFNQVKLVTTAQTVPAGKVWKIESVIYNIPEDQSSYQLNTGGCSITNYRSTSIVVDGTPTKVGQGTTTAAYSNLAYTHSYTPLPIWLPEGTTLSGGTCLNKVSVIEFNIVP